MLKFHTKYIPTLSSLYRPTDNFNQLRAYDKLNEILKKQENFLKVYKLKKDEPISFSQLLDSPHEASVVYALTHLKKEIGFTFRTTYKELAYITKSDYKTIEYILLILEEIKIISITRDAIFKIEYLNE